MKSKCHIGKKTLLEKEKLLVTSNFSFSHKVFHSYISLVHQNAALCVNGLIDNSEIVTTPRQKHFENTVEKRQNANN